MDFKQNTWECDGIETQELGPIWSREVKPLNETAMLHIVKFKNLRLNSNNGKKQIVIKGNSFLATLHYYYYHAFMDMMGKYALLKSHIPDLKCYFNSMFGKEPVWRNDFEDRSVESYLKYLKHNPFGREDSNPKINYHEFTRGLVNIFSEDGNIYTIESDNILFENFYVVSEIPTGFSGISIDHLRNIEFLSDMVLKFLKPSLNKNKIFISRKVNNDRYKKDLDIFSKNQSDVANRVFEEDKIEKYFNSIGYKSVILEGMPLIEQLNLFYNATHVVGLNGSGLVNLIASKNKTRVIELNLIESYTNRVEYNYMFKFKDFKFLSYKNFSGDVDKIIKELEAIEDK
jgi:hypothetical protein